MQPCSPPPRRPAGRAIRSVADILDATSAPGAAHYCCQLQQVVSGQYSDGSTHRCSLSSLHRCAESAVTAASTTSETGHSLHTCRKHQSRQRSRHSVGLVPLLSGVLVAACLAGPQWAAADKCTRYRGSGCHFTVRNDEPVVFPACLSHCNFEVEETMSCPFYSAGLFVTEEVEGPCQDDFMNVQPRPLLGCDKHCCSLEHSSGAFLPKATEARKRQLQYQPAGSDTCRFSQYTRDDILTALQGGEGEGEHPGMDILVVGDSLMRQLYSRLVHMLRGHRRVFDYKMHTHAAYSVCKEADAFKTAPYNGNRSALAARIDDQYLTDVVPRFFASAGNVEPGLLCSKPAVAVNYMHAPKWSDQAATLERYWPSASTDGRLPVVVLSVGFWEKSAEVPESSVCHPSGTDPSSRTLGSQPDWHCGFVRFLTIVMEEYLAMLTAMAGKVERVFFVGLPTSRVLHNEWAAAYASRNAAMKAWAAKVGVKAEFVDFDELARTPGGPPAGAEGNWHYSCFLQWPSWRNKKLEGLPGNYFRDRVYGHPIEGLVMTEDGECGDEMNRNLWQMVFNVLLGDKGVPRQALGPARPAHDPQDTDGSSAGYAAAGGSCHSTGAPPGGASSDSSNGGSGDAGSDFSGGEGAWSIEHRPGSRKGGPADDVVRRR